MSDVMISYRRQFDKHPAGRLREFISNKLPKTSVFMDVESIPAGSDFPEKIESEARNCSVMIAVIGPEWLNAKNERGHQRLFLPNDFIKLELSIALKRSIPVIPVLLDGVQMPGSELLPAELQLLSRRQAIDVTHKAFQRDADKLVCEIRSCLKKPNFLQVARQAFRRIFTDDVDMRLVKSSNNPVQLSHAGPFINSPQAPTVSVGAKSHTDVERFYSECVSTAPNASMTATELYEAYCEWCETHGIEELALPTFGREFHELGVQKVKIAGRVRYLGIGIRPAFHHPGI